MSAETSSRTDHRPSFDLLMRAQRILGDARDIEHLTGHPGVAMVLNDMVLNLFTIVLDDTIDGPADTAYRARYIDGGQPT